MVDFDPYSYETHEDPYPIYRALRNEAPVYYGRRRDFYALSRYDDVRAAVDDWETYSSAEGITIEPTSRGLEPMLLEMDPPRHTQLRALVSRAFTPKRVLELEEPTRRLARDLIDSFADQGACDLIADFSAILPMAVICLLLDIPRADHDMLRGWSDALLHRESGSSNVTPAGYDGAANLYGYFNTLIAERRSHMGDDLVSALIAAEEDGQALSPSEILGFCFLLIIAGNETTTKLLGNALFWLERYPDQRANVLADPSLTSAAIEEVLRFDGSTQALARVLTRDVSLHGETMREGKKLLLLFGSANRDERKWDRADEFDIGRNPAGHLAFGHGIHHCLGASLARLESRVALEELLPLVGEYEIDHDGLERVHSGNVRGYSRMPLRFTSAAAAR